MVYSSLLVKKKRKLEIAFEQHFPNQYSSKYSLVTFNENISYSEALKKGRAQDKAILNLIADGKLHEAIEHREVLSLVQRETQHMLHDDEVVKNL